MKRRVLVTGGAGFLGSHLCERLVDAGHDVILAAGKGTRMKSDLPKVLVEVRGRPMIDYVLDALERGGIEREFIEEAIPEFILYWRERGAAPRELNSKFIQHIRGTHIPFTDANRIGYYFCPNDILLNIIDSNRGIP